MHIVATEKFSVIDIVLSTVIKATSTRVGDHRSLPEPLVIFLDIDEPYTRKLILNAFQHPSRASYFQITLGPGKGWDAVPLPSHCQFQWAEYERIDWHNGVLLGRHAASSYFIRKGLSRKAQLAHFTHRHVCKYPNSILRDAIPQTVILDTWSVWDDDASSMMTHESGLADVVVNLGSTSRISDCSKNQRARLEKCLSQAREVMSAAENEYHLCGSDDETSAPVWILKGSTTNKGAGIYIVHLFEQVLDHCWTESTIREWFVKSF
jgi:hypothetical protein